MIEYEQQVIGTLMQGKALEYCDVLDEQDFTVYKKTFLAIKRADKVNPISIAKESDFHLSDLISLTGKAIPEMFESNVMVLKRESAKRKLVRILGEPRLPNVTEDIDKLISDLQNIQIYKKNGSIETKDLVFKYSDELDERKKNLGKEMYIGLPKLDKCLAGLHKKELTIIGARPSVGKSIFALQVAEQVAKRGYKVLFVTLEMADTQIMERMVVKHSGVESEKLRLGDLDVNDWKQIGEGYEIIRERNFTITSDIRTVGELRSNIITDRPDLVVIDYIGLLKDTSEKWNGNRWQEIASVARKLKLMTIDFNIPIVALAQLTRDSQNKRPTLADLRDSGELEQSADNVIMLHLMDDKEAAKEVYQIGYKQGQCVYGTEQVCANMIASGNLPTLLLVVKQRNGATPGVRTMLVTRRLEFTEVAE